LEYRKPQNLCPQCQSPLLARNDLAVAARSLSLKALEGRVHSMWRYSEVMPGSEPVSLGEGMTPLTAARRWGKHLGLDRLFVKDEGLNPTHSFKARGLSAAVTMARALGIDTIALPTAGNAPAAPGPRTRLMPRSAV
jgi:threonine synthase